MWVTMSDDLHLLFTRRQTAEEREIERQAAHKFLLSLRPEDSSHPVCCGTEPATRWPDPWHARLKVRRWSEVMDLLAFGSLLRFKCRRHSVQAKKTTMANIAHFSNIHNTVTKYRLQNYQIYLPQWPTISIHSTLYNCRHNNDKRRGQNDQI